jgi:hypothetical protein
MPQGTYGRLLVKLLDHIRVPQLVRLCPSCDRPMESLITRRHTIVDTCRQCGLTALAGAGELGVPRLVPVGLTR